MGQVRVSAPAPAPAAVFRVNTTSEPARLAFEQGYAAMLEQDYVTAATEFARAYQLDPRLGLARAFELNLRGRSPVIADTVDALAVRNGTANLIETLQFISIRERNAGQAGRANAVLAAAARSAYDDPRLLTEYHLWLAVGNATRVSIARSLRTANPSDYRAHAYVALAINAAADSADALTAMREALRLGPDRPLAHYAAGELLTRMGRLTEANTHYGHALQHNANYYLAQLGRADNTLLSLRPAEARRDYEVVVQRATFSPTAALARRVIAISYLYERNLDRALQEMTRVVREFEQEGGWRSQIGLGYRHLSIMAAMKKDVALVERSIAQAKSVQGEEAGLALYWAAIAWAVAGQPARARQELNEYERVVASGAYVPGAGISEAARAMVLMAEGKPAEALTAAGTSGNHWTWIATYQALTALGRTTEAQARLRQLLDTTVYAADAMARPAAITLYGR
jgi:tetratricopeptide (TPR) repeat protein